MEGPVRAREFGIWLAENTGYSHSEIDQRLRKLREDGIIPTGGRGLNAPQLGYPHTAAMLIALCGTETAVDAADAFHRFARLVPHGEGPFSGCKNFHEALTGILARTHKPVRVASVDLLTRGLPEARIVYHAEDGRRWQVFARPSGKTSGIMGPFVTMPEMFLYHCITGAALSDYEPEEIEAARRAAAAEQARRSNPQSARADAARENAD